jgi:hypothetical protein
MITIFDFLKFYLVPTLLICFVLLVVLMWSKRLILHNFNKKKQLVIQNTDLFLTSLIFEKNNKDKVEEKISELKSKIPFHKNWCKKIVINEMIRFKKNLKGESSPMIIALYKKLKLHFYTAGLVADLRYYQKCEGFYQFQHIDFKPAKKLIKPYLTHPDRIIRSNAYACYLSLVEGKVEQLANIPTKISLLNIIKLMELLHIKKIKLPKNIDGWLVSENKSVIRLGIKIMVFYNYANQEEKIIELLHSEDDTLRVEAIIACRALYFKNAETELISIYLHDNDNNKKEILRALKVIGGEKSEVFLEQLILYETDKTLKMYAVNALNSIDKKIVEKLSLNDNDTLRMLNHINDIYIV